MRQSLAVCYIIILCAVCIIDSPRLPSTIRPHFCFIYTQFDPEFTSTYYSFWCLRKTLLRLENKLLAMLTNRDEKKKNTISLLILDLFKLVGAKQIPARLYTEVEN